jgi:hypothetical protein
LGSFQLHTRQAGSDLRRREFGKPIDGGPALDVRDAYSLHGEAANPLDREHITQPLITGIRAIDGLLPCGKGLSACSPEMEVILATSRLTFWTSSSESCCSSSALACSPNTTSSIAAFLRPAADSSFAAPTAMA